MSTISPNLEKYINDISDKSSKVQLDGYYHVDAVIDAFNKGEENGRESVIERLREKLIRDSTKMFLYCTDVYSKLTKNGFDLKGFYINPFGFKFIVVTTSSNTINEDFISAFYELVFEAENKFSTDTNAGMHISFISEDNLNEHELNIDGYFKMSNG